MANSSKPLPLMADGKPYYTLSSYDPVSVEVLVPLVTDDDIDFALDAMLAQMGASREELEDPAWVAQTLPGIHDAGELRGFVRDQLTDANANLAEQQKVSACSAGLVERLNQRVPLETVARNRRDGESSLMQQMAQQGLTLDQFLMQMGMTRADYEEMLDAQAHDISQSAAALSAYAREKKLSVADSEIGPLLGIPEDQVNALVMNLRMTGRYNELLDGALQAKALQTAVSECVCTYRHETAAEAQARVEMVRLAREQAEASEDDAPGNGDTGMRLV